MSCQCESLLTKLAKELGYEVTKKCVNQDQRLIAARNNNALSGLTPAWPVPEPVYEFELTKKQEDSDKAAVKEAKREIDEILFGDK